MPVAQWRPAKTAVRTRSEGYMFNLHDWLGRSETLEDVVTAAPFSALSATLDHDPARPAVGTELPPLWHWLYFLPMPRQSEIGPDGHAKRGGFLPPVPLPRRMWAGGQFQFHSPLRVGDSLRRISTIESISEKSGRTGALIFVKVRHEIHANGATAPSLTEHHDIVYREAAKPGDPPSVSQAAPASAWEKKWIPDEVLLFRYSALTFNGHRIHYDRRYVTEVEGYPGPIVHGPLIATLLIELLREQMPAARIATFEFRAMRAMADMNHFFVCGAPQTDGKTVRLWARDHEGWLAMDATASMQTDAEPSI